MCPEMLSFQRFFYQTIGISYETETIKPNEKNFDGISQGAGTEKQIKNISFYTVVIFKMAAIKLIF